MRKEDVPQQHGLNNGCKEVSYAVDESGQYILTQSTGWDVKTIALQQAWEEINEQLLAVLDSIKAGEKSPLAYHMVKNQMDPALLAQYSGVSRWQVKRHLKPRVFNKLSAAALSPYLNLFDLTIEQLKRVPDHPEVLLADLKTAEGSCCED